MAKGVNDESKRIMDTYGIVRGASIDDFNASGIENPSQMQRVFQGLASGEVVEIPMRVAMNVEHIANKYGFE